MSELCPHCGFNLSQDKPIERGHWMLTPDACYFEGQRVSMTPSEAGFLHTLAKADGRIVRSEVIGLRLGHAEEPAVLSRTYACRLRKKLPQVPFEAVRRHGYRWAI